MFAKGTTATTSLEGGAGAGDPAGRRADIHHAANPPKEIPTASATDAIASRRRCGPAEWAEASCNARSSSRADGKRSFGNFARLRRTIAAGQRLDRWRQIGRTDVQDCTEDVHRRLAAERAPACRQLVEHRAESKDVGALIDR